MDRTDELLKELGTGLPFEVDWEQYQRDERRRAAQRSAGGDFYLTQDVRLGRRFAHAVIRAAKEGRLLYRDAYRLTGLHGETFDKYAEALGFTVTHA